MPALGSTSDGDARTVSRYLGAMADPDSFNAAVDEILAREIDLALKAGLDPTPYREPGTITEAEIATAEAGLGVRYPPELRAFLRRAVGQSRAEGSGVIGRDRRRSEFAFARMTDVLLAGSWQALADRLYGGSRALAKALEDARLVPLGDDYSGHYWICIALDDPTGARAPVVELDLERWSEGEPLRLTPVGESFFGAVAELHAKIAAGG